MEPQRWPQTGPEAKEYFKVVLFSEVCPRFIKFNLNQRILPAVSVDGPMLASQHQDMEMTKAWKDEQAKVF